MLHERAPKLHLKRVQLSLFGTAQISFCEYDLICNIAYHIKYIETVKMFKGRLQLKTILILTVQLVDG